MNRFIANYIIAYDADEHRWRIHINHIATIDDDGGLSFARFEREMPNTRFVGRTAVIAPVTKSHRDLLDTLCNRRDPDDIADILNRSEQWKNPTKPYHLLVL